MYLIDNVKEQLIILLIANIIPIMAHAKVIEVGPGRIYQKPSEVAMVAEHGDHIQIDPGIYENDTAVWSQNDLFIYGKGRGRVHLKVNDVAAEGKAIWVFKGNNTKIANIEFSGARVDAKNGAGIRQEGLNLRVFGCYFHDNENGILIGDNFKSNILIVHSVFSNNGAGDGQSHNLYIGRVRKLVIKYCYIHHARIGHNVKSRAFENYILYNRIMDENSGKSSYSVDLPNGGTSILIGNNIHQGIHAENFTIVSFAAEGEINPSKGLYVVNNTFVNDCTSGIFINNWSDKTLALVMNNIFCGPAKQIVKGISKNFNNFRIQKKLSSDFLTKRTVFLNPSIFDYRLKYNSPAIDSGVDPGSALGFSLIPKWHYKHIAGKQKRIISGKIDVGAYEFD